MWFDTKLHKRSRAVPQSPALVRGLPPPLTRRLAAERLVPGAASLLTSATGYDVVPMLCSLPNPRPKFGLYEYK